MKVLVINGPNLNMLGKREPATYGSQNLQQIVDKLTIFADSIGLSVTHVQSNAEHTLIDTVHNAFEKIDFIVINPGAFTHTSIALRDALLSVSIPFIEVHLSNVHAREAFRQHSYLSDIAQGVICGLGAQGYEFALAAAKQYLTKHQQNLLAD